MLSRAITRNHDSGHRRSLHRHVPGATFILAQAEILVFFADHAHAYRTKSVGGDVHLAEPPNRL